MISDSRPKPVQTPPIKSSAHNEPHPSAFFYVIVQIQMNLCYAMEFDEIVMVELNLFQIRERKKKNPGLNHILYGTGRKQNEWAASYSSNMVPPTICHLFQLDNK